MIWCVGMYGSASTWAFNAVWDTAKIVLPTAKITTGYADTMAMLAPFQNPDGIYIIKTHHLPAAETQFLERRASRIVITIRDPRDAVTSLMQHMRHRFSTALATVEQSAAYCASFAKDPRALVLRYESEFFERPDIFDEFSALFGKSLSPQQRGKLFEESRRAVIDAKIARLAELPTSITDARSGDVVDTQTQWHSHHAGRTGEIGRWARMLPAEATRIIEQRLGPWMQNFGYRI